MGRDRNFYSLWGGSAQAYSAAMPTYPGRNRRKPTSCMGAYRLNRSPEAVPTGFARVDSLKAGDKAGVHMGRQKWETTEDHDGTPIFGAQFA